MVELILMEKEGQWGDAGGFHAIFPHPPASPHMTERCGEGVTEWLCTVH